MIYVISATGTEFVKVGIARNPVHRMKCLQTGQPTKLVILAIADWPNSAERRIHVALSQFRVEGEWFRSGPQIDRLVKHMHAGDNSPMPWLEGFLSPPRLARVLRIAR